MRSADQVRVVLEGDEDMKDAGAGAGCRMLPKAVKAWRDSIYFFGLVGCLYTYFVTRPRTPQVCDASTRAWAWYG